MTVEVGLGIWRNIFLLISQFWVVTLYRGDALLEPSQSIRAVISRSRSGRGVVPFGISLSPLCRVTTVFSYLTGNPFFRQPFCGMWATRLLFLDRSTWKVLSYQISESLALSNNSQTLRIPVRALAYWHSLGYNTCLLQAGSSLEI